MSTARSKGIIFRERILLRVLLAALFTAVGHCATATLLWTGQQLNPKLADGSYRYSSVGFTADVSPENPKQMWFLF